MSDDTDEQAAGLRQLAAKFSTGYRSVGDMVYDILRDAILSGTLAPGQKLRQESLAETIGVSRVPVRSALIQLEADGLVELHDRRGAVVTSLSSEQIEEIYAMRSLLELHALRLSMGSMTPERVANLRELATVADAEEEGAGFVDARAAFYAELYGADKHPILWEHIQQLRLKVGRYVLGWRLVSADSHSHENLIAAVEAGDADSATALLDAHLSSIRDGVLNLLAEEAAESNRAAAQAVGAKQGGATADAASLAH
jgi:DNA-binding GntR family transcriptional regulator